jgi:hypothetical protein
MADRVHRTTRLTPLDVVVPKPAHAGSDMPAPFMHKNLDRYLMKQENQQALESNVEWKLNRMREEYNAISKAYLAVQLKNFQLQAGITKLETEIAILRKFATSL